MCGQLVVNGDLKLGEAMREGVGFSEIRVEGLGRGAFDVTQLLRFACKICKLCEVENLNFHVSGFVLDWFGSQALPPSRRLESERS